MEGSNLFNLSNNVQSTQPTDSTAETFCKIYTKLPRSVNSKIGLVALLVILGLVGLLGNGLIHYFVLKKKSFPLLQSTPFVRNFNLYIRSLTLSNILSSKIGLVALLVILGLVGLLGNGLIHYFVLKKKSFPLLQSTPFVRNFNLYIRSLTLSNILSSSVSLPLLSLQLFDIFHNDWPCRIVRYIGMLFPTIALNNLIFISQG